MHFGFNNPTIVLSLKFWTFLLCFNQYHDIVSDIEQYYHETMCYGWPSSRPMMDWYLLTGPKLTLLSDIWGIRVWTAAPSVSNLHKPFWLQYIDISPGPDLSVTRLHGLIPASMCNLQSPLVMKKCKTYHLCKLTLKLYCIHTWWSMFG